MVAYFSSPDKHLLLEKKSWLVERRKPSHLRKHFQDLKRILYKELLNFFSKTG